MNYAMALTSVLVCGAGPKSAFDLKYVARDFPMVGLLTGTNMNLKIPQSSGPGNNIPDGPSAHTSFYVTPRLPTEIAFDVKACHR